MRIEFDGEVGIWYDKTSPVDHDDMDEEILNEVVLPGDVNAEFERLETRVEGLEREKHPEFSVTAGSGGIALYVNGERRPITPHALDGGRWITYKEIAAAWERTEDLRADLQKLEQPEIERITCNVRDELMRELGIDSPVAPCRESADEHPSDARAGRDAPFETETDDG